MTPAPRLSSTLIAILQELLGDSKSWRYGYDLTQSTGVKPGTLYPLLMRLSDEGWLESSWEERVEGGRPPRHLYRLNAVGKREARAALSRARERGWIETGRRSQA